MQTIRELINHQAKLNQEISTTTDRLEKLRQDKRQVDKELAEKPPGLDTKIEEIASYVLEIEGDWSKALDFPEGEKVLETTLIDLAEGAVELKTKYFGVKYYAHWPCQIVSIQYGYAPEHGTVWASIGLSKKYRQVDLLQEEINACILYLKQFTH